MHVGLVMFATQSTMNVVELGQEAEQRGFESLFLPEHSHIPATGDIERPKGGGLPKAYRHIFDPFVALAAVAARTERLRVGTGICLVTQRDPILLAKEISSLDVLSGGRVLLGVGAGWLVEEMANHGTDAHRRFAVLRERILAMQTIWTSDVAEFHGEFVDFTPLWQWPKPLQQPHPPILLGGDGPGIVNRLVAYGDGWLPFPGAAGDDALVKRIGQVRAEAEDRGKISLPITVFGAAPDPAVLEVYRSIGVERCLLWLPAGSGTEVMQAVDRYTELIRQIS